MTMQSLYNKYLHRIELVWFHFLELELLLSQPNTVHNYNHSEVAINDN